MRPLRPYGMVACVNDVICRAIAFRPDTPMLIRFPHFELRSIVYIMPKKGFRVRIVMINFFEKKDGQNGHESLHLSNKRLYVFEALLGSIYWLDIFGQLLA